MTGIVGELRANQPGMREVMRAHRAAAVGGIAVIARHAATATLSRGEAKPVLSYAIGYQENIPLSVAWQIAQNDQGLTLLPYHDRYDLAWIYEMQNVYYRAEERYEATLLLGVGAARRQLLFSRGRPLESGQRRGIGREGARRALHRRR